MHLGHHPSPSRLIASHCFWVIYITRLVAHIVGKKKMKFIPLLAFFCFCLKSNSFHAEANLFILKDVPSAPTVSRTALCITCIVWITSLMASTTNVLIMLTIMRWVVHSLLRPATLCGRDSMCLLHVYCSISVPNPPHQFPSNSTQLDSHMCVDIWIRPVDSRYFHENDFWRQNLSTPTPPESTSGPSVQTDMMLHPGK